MEENLFPPVMNISQVLLLPTSTVYTTYPPMYMVSLPTLSIYWSNYQGSSYQYKLSTQSFIGEY